MMKEYIAGIVALLLVSTGLFLWTFKTSPAEKSAFGGGIGSNMGSSTRPELPKNFTAEGTIVKDNPGLEPHAWYLVYETSGQPTKTVKLLFHDQKSICVGKTASGTCNPKVFIKGRHVRVEGAALNGALRVYKLTFTDSVAK